jgi:hypothetical protein
VSSPLHNPILHRHMLFIYTQHPVHNKHRL